MLPAGRPDKALNVEKPTFAAYIDQLSKVSGIEIKDFASLKAALCNRMDFFASMGCCVSDHALEYVMYLSLIHISPKAARGKLPFPGPILLKHRNPL